jgi:phosphoglycolate phosphatase
MHCHAIIFDLDGTLLDTLTDIADCANRVLAAHGFPSHPAEAYRWFVGDGSAMLMTRALPENQRLPETVQHCLRGFITDYNLHWNRATRPYDDILDLLGNLQNRGIKLAVVTNKPHQFTASMMAHYFGQFHFSAILGQQDGIPPKPHPRQALAAAGQMGVAPSACIFIGDSAVDMQTAQKSGMRPVGAAWGFRTPAELLEAGAWAVINHPLELLDLLEG